MHEFFGEGIRNRGGDIDAEGQSGSEGVIVTKPANERTATRKDKKSRRKSKGGSERGNNSKDVKNGDMKKVAELSNFAGITVTLVPLPVDASVADDAGTVPAIFEAYLKKVDGSKVSTMHYHALSTPFFTVIVI